MATLFISDLHLSEKRPKVTALFLNFLEKEGRNADALYILGDFFETWLGDDIAAPHDTQVIEALKQYSKTGVPLFFMHGNRDFLIGKRFVNQTGCTLLADPTLLDLYGTPVLLSHGDALCTLDVEYQHFRKWVRRPITKWYFLMLPLFYRRHLAKKVRRKSPRTQTKTYDSNDPRWDVVQDDVHQLLRRHQSQILIHGHTHKPGIHDFELDGKSHQRIVLGDWNDKGSVLVWARDNIELKEVS